MTPLTIPDEDRARAFLYGCQGIAWGRSHGRRDDEALNSGIAKFPSRRLTGRIAIDEAGENDFKSTLAEGRFDLSCKIRLRLPKSKRHLAIEERRIDTNQTYTIPHAPRLIPSSMILPTQVMTLYIG
jgi:hypothetical protein